VNAHPSSSRTARFARATGRSFWRSAPTSSAPGARVLERPRGRPALRHERGPGAGPPRAGAAPRGPLRAEDRTTWLDRCRGRDPGGADRRFVRRSSRRRRGARGVLTLWRDSRRCRRCVHLSVSRGRQPLSPAASRQRTPLGSTPVETRPHRCESSAPSARGGENTRVKVAFIGTHGVSRPPSAATWRRR
jgi:hypothetical protein